MSGPHAFLLPHHHHSLLAGAAAGGAGGDDDPHDKPPLKSTHEADTVAAKIKKRRVPDSCPVCRRAFRTVKALHGHMRCHPERAWRGMAPPAREKDVAAGQSVQLPEKNAEAAEEEEAGRFQCKNCMARFRTRQALGGHRASHKSKKGCYWRSREQAAVAGGNGGAKKEESGGGKNNGSGGGGGVVERKILIDLNLPPPPDEEEEDDGGQEQLH